MQPISEYRLNHLPQEIHDLILNELDFNSCRNLRLTCWDNYKTLDQLQIKLGQKAYKLGTLELAPAPNELMAFRTAICISSSCSSLGIVGFTTGAILLCVKSFGFFLPFGIMTGSLGGCLGGVTLGLTLGVCGSDYFSHPEVKLKEFDPNYQYVDHSDDLAVDS